MIGAGAKVSGNIHVGQCSRVAVGSVVLHEVPASKTVAGVPAKVVGDAGCIEPAKLMDQQIPLADWHKTRHDRSHVIGWPIRLITPRRYGMWLVF